MPVVSQFYLPVKFIHTQLYTKSILFILFFFIASCRFLTCRLILPIKIHLKSLMIEPKKKEKKNNY